MDPKWIVIVYFEPPTENTQPVIWSGEFSSYDAADEINEWFRSETHAFTLIIEDSHGRILSDKSQARLKSLLKKNHGRAPA